MSFVAALSLPCHLAHRLTRLRPTIHPGAHPRPVTEGIPFLGFIIYPGQRRLKRRKGVYYRRKLRRLTDAYARCELSFEDVDASVQGWINHVSYGNTVGLRKALFRATPLFAPHPSSDINTERRNPS